MTLKATISVTNPKAIPMTMYLTMTVEEWVQISDVIDSQITEQQGYWHPANQLIRSIKELTQKIAVNIHYYDPETEPEK